MAIEIKAPAFPESVADGEVATWHKQPGETVKRDELIVEIETDTVCLNRPARLLRHGPPHEQPYPLKLSRCNAGFNESHSRRLLDYFAIRQHPRPTGLVPSWPGNATAIQPP